MAKERNVCQSLFNTNVQPVARQVPKPQLCRDRGGIGAVSLPSSVVSKLLSKAYVPGGMWNSYRSGLTQHSHFSALTHLKNSLEGLWPTPSQKNHLLSDPNLCSCSAHLALAKSTASQEGWRAEETQGSSVIYLWSSESN